MGRLAYQLFLLKTDDLARKKDPRSKIIDSAVEFFLAPFFPICEVLLSREFPGRQFRRPWRPWRRRRLRLVSGSCSPPFARCECTAVVRAHEGCARASAAH
jgi:hypothetical protein